MIQLILIIINIIYLLFRLGRLPIYFIKNYMNMFKDKKIMKIEDFIQLSPKKPKSIISWNIQELFLYTNKWKVQNIINYLKTEPAEILCLQEVFEDPVKKKLLRNLSYKYPYHISGNDEKNLIIGEDSGLMVFSKYPIKKIKFSKLKNTFFPDNMASKGILYFKIQGINFLTTHLQSNYEIISQQQLKQMIDDNPFKNENYIITGDLNHTRAEIYLKCSKNNFDITFPSDKEILDYIIPINNNKNNKLKVKTKVNKIDLTNTSDHYPIFAKIIYK